MTNQCPTCGGKLAHYTRVPAGYCTVHSNWFTTNLRCASSASNDCSSEPDSKEFGFVCPTDGTRLIMATPQITPDDMQLVDDIKDFHGGGTAAHSPDFQLKHVPLFLKQHSEDCIDPACPGSHAIDVGEGKTRKVIKETETGAMQLTASMQKTAMWYYLKPRWILRRKMQAAVRRKVRSVLAPIGAIKSSK